MPQSQNEAPRDGCSSKANQSASPPPHPSLLPPSKRSTNHEHRLLKTRRTVKACDRCRMKKSKCDGQTTCRACFANALQCTYSARRRRDMRTWECDVQETMEVAVHRLYSACRATGSFPGIMENDRSGHVTTLDILKGIGLVRDHPHPSFVAAFGVGGGSRFAQPSSSSSLIDNYHTHTHDHDHPDIKDHSDYVYTATSPSHSHRTASISTSTRSGETQTLGVSNTNAKFQRRKTSKTPHDMCQQFEDLTDPQQSFLLPYQRDFMSSMLQDQTHQQPNVQSQDSSTPILNRTIDPTSVSPLWYHFNDIAPPMHTISSSVMPRYEVNQSWGPYYYMNNPSTGMIDDIQSQAQ